MQIKAVLFDFFGVMFLPRQVGFSRRFVPNQSLLEFSQRLRSQYKVGLLSNMGAGTMDKYFTQKQLHDYFDTVIISGEIEMIKPEPGIYKLAAKTLNLDPAECVLIDDSEVNCLGAERAGMKAVRYESAGQVIDYFKGLGFEG